ncbi:MAG TPA: SMP-30/gluconolactonase/LRE family protein [Chloroflexota bacterium]|jgi:gluconolactonase
MTEETRPVPVQPVVSRRTLIRVAAVAAGAAALAPSMVFAAGQPQPANQGTPPSVITNPPRQWGPGSEPETYPDPDIIQLDPSFGQYMLGITAIHRLWTGSKWAEGPAWSAQGNYLVFSDVQGNKQYRYIWDDGRVTVFRDPSNNSNGNSFDFAGRQLSTEDFNRRVVRWEHDGTLKVIADSYQGKPLNSPNDLVPHPDGSIWFTDPPYGDTLSEGHPDFPNGPTNPNGRLNPETGAPNAGVIGGQTRQNPAQVYRWDPSGSVSAVIPEEDVGTPNGIAFSPDYKTLYVISTGKGPGQTGPGGDGKIYQWDVSADGKSVSNKRLFTDMVVDGVHCGPDGLRADVDGNMWCSSNAPLGYSGVLTVNPAGKVIGRIRLPEVCANVAFGGPKRNFLMMCGSQSLYALQVQTQGAAPG